MQNPLLKYEINKTKRELNTLNFCDTILDNKYMICVIVDDDGDDVNDEKEKNKKSFYEWQEINDTNLHTYTNMHHFSQCKICIK